ncbi:hypothetical protein JCM21900_003037 [Sporobolomyces salmonicolor]
MFSGTYPSTSPASFSTQTSFLQQAMQSGQTSLHGGPTAPSTSPSPGSSLDDERGRLKVRRSDGRLSIGSGYSTERRLSPTREGDETTDEESEAPFEDEEEDRRSSRSPPVYVNRAQLAAADEHTPLLGPSTSSITITPADTQAFDEARRLKDEADMHAAKGEVAVLLRYTVPILGTHFLEYSLMLAVVLSCGHLGTAELAGASLANMTANVSALSVIQGFVSALDTLCPQAYTSPRPKDTSLHALRTLVICLIANIPQIFFFYHAEWILREGLKQDPEVAFRAGQYLKAFAFGLPAYTGFEVTRRWLQAQGLMTAPVLALVFAAPVNFALNWLLVWSPWEGVRIGFIGAPIATAVSINVMFFTLLIYSFFYAPRDAWGGFDKRMFSGLGLNLRLGFAGIAMVGSEWWCWEMVGLATSYLGPTALAAQSVLLTTASLFYQCQYALSVAAAVRVGNLLGAQKPRLARVTSRMTILIAVIVSAFNSTVLVVFRGVWGRLFSSEPAIVRIVAGVLPLVAAFQLMDGLSGAMSGVLRGAGKPGLGAYINILSYYIIGLPVGMMLTFLGPKLGLNGLWVGLTVALTCTSISLTYIVWGMNWEKESETTRVRLGVAKRDEED